MDERDLKLSRKLQKIARRLRDVIEKEMGEPMGFGLVVFPFAKEGAAPDTLVEFQYISNVERTHMHESMRALVKKWDKGEVDTPPHERLLN